MLSVRNARGSGQINSTLTSLAGSLEAANVQECLCFAPISLALSWKDRRDDKS